MRALLFVTALVLSLLAMATRAGAQTTQYDEEIATLRKLIEDFESGRSMIVSSHPPSVYGWFFSVEREQFDDIAGWMVFSGQLDPDSVQSWTRQMRSLSQGAVAIMKKQLVELEERRVAPPPPPPPPANAALPPGAAYWPTPMDWREVRGTVRGTYSIPCSYDRASLKPVRGTFSLELRGQGIALGSFTDTDDRTVQEMNGTITDSGLAHGDARSINAITAWSARFVRVGNDLKLENPQLTMVPFADGARCDPGVIQQQ
jgi:hypothetical protein